ncbi:MAG: sulfite exporter TauE/SafE family protein [Actinobacteria bacterium]|jgi:uncharacterized membrane protein YfcA|nr:sulfite exporter TauE/SafE family protein [Actinomycetota bacterium]NBP90832.1 sulfite exporter TauE/SafE family protein [Actinomycetota bacterium]
MKKGDGVLELSFHTLLIILIAGFAAGFINSIVGSGTLITFPALLAAGLPPLVANTSNNVGLVPGAFAAMRGSRHSLAGDRHQIRALMPFSVAGALLGALALLLLPKHFFGSVVPWLVLTGVALNITAPIVSSLRRRPDQVVIGVGLRISVLLTGIYGGYFGAAQGVILIGLLTLLLDESVARSNAMKNYLAGATNLIASFVFLLSGQINWLAALLIGLSSYCGASVGSRVGRGIPSWIYRLIITTTGLYASYRLFTA